MAYDRPATPGRDPGLNTIADICVSHLDRSSREALDAIARGMGDREYLMLKTGRLGDAHYLVLNMAHEDAEWWAKWRLAYPEALRRALEYAAELGAAWVEFAWESPEHCELPICA